MSASYAFPFHRTTCPPEPSGIQRRSTAPGAGIIAAVYEHPRELRPSALGHPNHPMAP